MINILQKDDFINLDEYFDEKIIDGKIYKITNLVNGKIYIGQTIRSIEQRWKSHIYNALKSINESPLYNSIKLRGKENFKIEQIDSATTYSELNQKEYDWIIKENCLAPHGYNLRNGGDVKGISEETRDKMRHLKTGCLAHNKNKKRYYNSQSNVYKYFYDNEHIDDGFEICVKPQSQKFFNEITHEIIYLLNDDIIPDNFILGSGPMMWYFDSLNNKYVKISKYQINIPVHYIKGFKKQSQESNEKRSCSLKGHLVSEETRKKISHAQIDKIISETTIAKMSLSHLGKKQSEETKLKRSQSMKGKHKNKKQYYNPQTMETIMISSECIVPDGFIPGSTKGKNKGKRHFYNPESLKCIFIDPSITEIPEGFVMGRKPK